MVFSKLDLQAAWWNFLKKLNTFLCNHLQLIRLFLYFPINLESTKEMAIFISRRRFSRILISIWHFTPFLSFFFFCFCSTKNIFLLAGLLCKIHRSHKKMDLRRIMRHINAAECPQHSSLGELPVKRFLKGSIWRGLLRFSVATYKSVQSGTWEQRYLKWIAAGSSSWKATQVVIFVDLPGIQMAVQVEHWVIPQGNLAFIICLLSQCYDFIYFFV